MRKTEFIKALHLLAGGCLLLGMSIWNVVLNHKALTLLIFSLLANFILTFSLMTARAERDSYNKKLYRTECKLDSVSILTTHWNGRSR